MSLLVTYKKKIVRTKNFASLKSPKKGVGSGAFSQRYGSPDPDLHQYITDPQHCFLWIPPVATECRPDNEPAAVLPALHRGQDHLGGVHHNKRPRQQLPGEVKRSLRQLPIMNNTLCLAKVCFFRQVCGSGSNKMVKIVLFLNVGQSDRSSHENTDFIPIKTVHNCLKTHFHIFL